jgi:Na+/glutamate symporter
MQLNSEKLVAVASKVKTPLALSGLIVAVLYALYRQVLSLPVFENIGANPTFLLLENVLGKLFWLALIALILGVASYIVTVVLSHKMPSSSSNVTLVNTSNDPNDSSYEERLERGEKWIRLKDKPPEERGINDRN